MFFGISLLFILLPLVAYATPYGSTRYSRDFELAKRRSGDVELHKRFSDTRWTFYNVGLGTCGRRNAPSDFVVALNIAQYGQNSSLPGPQCFKTITMTYNGKTTQATITDECLFCPYGGLDLSPGLFQFFAPLSAGIIYGDWYFTNSESSSSS